MVGRKGAHIALGCTLLLAFQLYGVAELIRNEPPRGSVFGVVYSERTLATIPKAYIQLELIEPFGEQPRPEPPPEEKATQERRQQGWHDYWWHDYEGEGYPSRWETYADSEGRFQLRGIPAGIYRVYASGEVHSVDPEDLPHIEINEGARVEYDIALYPFKSFLDLIHPQAVYYPDEPLRMGIRGFNEAETLKLTLYRLRNTRQEPPVALYDFLDQMRYGWWQSEDRLARDLERYAPYMSVVWRHETPIRGRDPEGLFTQYVEVPKQPEGTYLLLVESGENRRVGPMVVSSVAVVSKVSGEAAELWCTDLRTGQPIRDAEITVYQARRQSRGDNQQVVYEPVRTGRTNANGLWRYEPIVRPEGRWRDRLVAVKSPRSGQMVHWGRPETAVWHGEGGSGKPLTGVIYTERPIYRPGHTIHFKGIARLGEPFRYELPPPNTPVQISVRTPRDEVVYETRTVLNRMGAFHGSFTASPEAETGFYRIQARIGGYGTIEDSVPISAYRKPTYRITVKPDRELYMPNETVRVQINTDYYFGMPVPNTQLSYTLYRREKWNWNYYSEDEYDYLDWGEEYDYGSGGYGEVVKTGKLTTDSAGRARLILYPSDLMPTDSASRPLYRDESDITYEYTLEMYALSEGWEGARAEAEFELAPSVWQATLRPDSEFGNAGRVYRYTVRLTDRRTGQPVQAILNWQAGKQLFAGNRIHVEPRFEGTIQTNAQGVAEFQFTPDVSGDWEVQITARDSDGNPFKARYVLWIWDDDYQPWWAGRTRDANALEARLNKRVFEPGESAELALRTPHSDAVFYITLEGERLYQSQIVKAQGTLTRVRIPLSREHIPNAYVSVCMVRNKELVQRVLEVRVGQQLGALQVNIQTDKLRYEPGEILTARILTADAQGRPAPAEVSLAVVDEAIYSIREDSPAAPRRVFYGRRYNTVFTDFSAVWLALQGDKGTAETVRRDFPDTAFWQPTIMTDARGQATLRLKLPDNLTEWRLTAIAHTADTKIGFARAKVKASKDLMARLRLPMWLIEGDRTEISAILSNDTDQPRTVQVELRAPDGVRTQTATVPARNSTTLRWDYEAKALGIQKFTLIAREVNGRLRDAEERTLEIKPRAITEADSRAILLNGERQISFTLRPDARPELTTLTLRSMPGATTIALDSLPYLLEYPYGCVEQTVSRFVPAVLAKRASEQAGAPLDAATQRKIAEITQLSLERLRRMQTYDGGWGWWEAEESTLWTTAYAVWGLHKAKQAGVNVPSALYQDGVNALRRLIVQMVSPEEPHEQDSVRLRDPFTLFALLTLAEVDPTPPDALRSSNWLEEQIEYFLRPLQQERDNYFRQSVQHRRVELIHILLRWRSWPDAEQHLKNLWQALRRDALEDRNYIDWSPNRTDEPWWYWCDWSAIETQALALQALLLSRDHAAQWFGSPDRYEQLVSKTLIGLSQGYRNGYWYQSRDTALAIEALLEYGARYERDFAAREAEYEVQLNGQPVQRITVASWGARRFVQPLMLRNLAWRLGENVITLRPVRGAPLVSVVFTQARSAPMAEDPAGPLRLRVYRLERPAEMTVAGERLRPLRSGDTVRTGELLRIDVEARMPQKVSRLDYTVLETPFPAGCAPFDTEAFLTAWWWDYAYEEIRDDRSVAFRQYWSRGDSYRYTLLVRAETPGEYTLLPAHLWGMYAPYQAHSNGFKLRIQGN
jgi:uncharacterized protein YfaS (alpha-2-macroglobulin family)